ncbi:hypothetical protein [Amycolatopsis sp. cmx-8-4]|uniref:hypothetical protein n=1 Tax=Amycolatopsis sp. cmx-8-4 TaxID=2790947 RepID=UPI003979144F
MTGENRPADGGRSPAVLRAENAASRLHKNAGVRRPGLRSELGADLRGIWGIADDDPPHRVCAIVHLRLVQVLRSMAEPASKLEQIVLAAYNAGPVPLSGNKTERLASIPGRSGRSCDRDLRPFQEELLVSLRTGRQPLSAHEIGAAERRFAARPAGPDPVAAPRNPIHGFHTDADQVVRWFLGESWCAPADAVREPIVLDLGERGAWLCVFSDQGALDHYRGTVGCGWPLSLSGTGREFAGRVHGRAAPTGLLVDPSPHRGRGAERAFSLSPSLIAQLSPDFPS